MWVMVNTKSELLQFIQRAMDEAKLKNAEHNSGYYFWLADKIFGALQMIPQKDSTKPLSLAD